MPQAIEVARAEVNRLVALGRSLEATEWNVPSRCHGWSVADVFGHVCNDFERYEAWLADSLKGKLDPPFAPEEFRADNALLLERFTGVPGPERLDALKRTAARWFRKVAPLDPATRQRHPRATMTLETQLWLCAGECALHGWDVASALARPWPPPQHLDLIVPVYDRYTAVPDEGELWTRLLVATGRQPE